MIFLDLILGFLKVGCFSFGGAYSAIPLIWDVVESYGWLTEDQLAYMIAIAESTPGPLMVNLATYVGSSQAGLPGAILATLAVITPAFIIIILVMNLLRNVLNNRYVQAVIQGLVPCVTGIIAAIGAGMILRHCFPLSSGSFVNLRSVVIVAALFAIVPLYQKVRKKKLSPIMLIVISAILGILLF